jgi:hypothetical protein
MLSAADTLLLLTIVGAALWLRSEFKLPHHKVLLLLSIQSREEEEGIRLPDKSILVRKFLQLPAIPVPGMELDGQGAGPLKITQTILTERDITVHVAPLRLPVEDVEGYAKIMVKDFGWETIYQSARAEA